MKRTELGIDVEFLLSLWGDARRPPAERKDVLREAILRESCDQGAAPKAPDVVSLTVGPAADEPSSYEWWERLADRVDVGRKDQGDSRE